MTEVYWPELENNSLIFGDYGTGYYNVCIHYDESLITGYTFVYMFDFTRDRRCRFLTSISLSHLRKRVIEEGHEWKVLDVEAAMNTLTLNMLDLHERNIVLAQKMIDRGLSGVEHVKRCIDGDREYWMYYHIFNGKKVRVFADTLSELHGKVNKYNAPWVIYDERFYYWTLAEEKGIFINDKK